VTVGVRNWGGRTGVAVVTFSDAGIVLKELEVRLNSSSSRDVQGVFTLDSIGVHTLEVAVSGDFPVKLYTNVTVVSPFLRVSAPSKVLLGSTFNVTVTKYTGEPASAFVSFISRIVVTDSAGLAKLEADQLGTHALTANLTGFANGTAAVKVVDPSEYPSSFSPSVVSFTVSPSLVQSSDEVSCVVVIDNNGMEPGSLELTLYQDGTPRLQSNISMAGMSSYVWSFRLSAPAPGTHYLDVWNLSQELVVEPWFADNPGIVQIVIRYGGSSYLSSSSDIPIYRAAKISEGNVAAALFSLGAVSGVLSVIAISSVFANEVAQSRRKLGILRTIGAGRTQIWKQAFSESLEYGLAGVAIGVAFGIIVADILSRSSVFLLFGHGLVLDFDTSLLVLVLGSSLVVCLASASVAAVGAVGLTAIRSIKGLDEETDEQDEAADLLED
jgi:hypothetical protein